MKTFSFKKTNTALSNNFASVPQKRKHCYFLKKKQWNNRNQLNLVIVNSSGSKIDFLKNSKKNYGQEKIFMNISSNLSIENRYFKTTSKLLNKKKFSIYIAKIDRFEKKIDKFWNTTFDKGRLKNFVSWFLKNYGERKTIELLEQFKKLGFGYATQGGISLGIDDLLIPPQKMNFLYSSHKMVSISNTKYKNAQITAVEKTQLFIDTWNETSENLKKEVVRYFEKTNIFNPVYMMAFSGARGNISQVRQLVGMRGLMSDPQGNIIDFPIQSNFREGLTLTEYIISTYGARKGIVDTALRTATAGYLTRRLVDVAQHVMISLFDCKTIRGIFVFDMKEGNQTLYSFQNRLIGRVLANDFKINESVFLGFRNQEISIELAMKISKFSKKAFIRSPLTCQSSKFVCQLCYGWSLSSNKLVSLGEAVGVIAAQSIGEPGTQLTMRTFHTGGVFAGGMTESVVANHNGWIEYLEPIPGTCVRTLQGKMAFLTKTESSFLLKKSSNLNPDISERETLRKMNKKDLSLEISFHKIPSYALLFVRHYESVFQKQMIAQFSSDRKQLKTQKGNAEQTVYADFEGEIYLNQIDLLEQRSNVFMQDTLWKSYDKSKIWILSGKIYQNTFLGSQKFLIQNNDFINKNSIFERLSWYSSKSQIVEFLFSNSNKTQQSESSNFPIFNLFSRKKFVQFYSGNFKTSVFSTLPKQKSSLNSGIPAELKMNPKKRVFKTLWAINENKRYFQTKPFRSSIFIPGAKLHPYPFGVELNSKNKDEKILNLSLKYKKKILPNIFNKYSINKLNIKKIYKNRSRENAPFWVQRFGFTNKRYFLLFPKDEWHSRKYLFCNFKRFVPYTFDVWGTKDFEMSQNFNKSFKKVRKKELLLYNQSKFLTPYTEGVRYQMKNGSILESLPFKSKKKKWFDFLIKYKVIKNWWSNSESKVYTEGVLQNCRNEALTYNKSVKLLNAPRALKTKFLSIIRATKVHKQLDFVPQRGTPKGCRGRKILKNSLYSKEILTLKIPSIYYYNNRLPQKGRAVFKKKYNLKDFSLIDRNKFYYEIKISKNTPKTSHLFIIDYLNRLNRKESKQKNKIILTTLNNQKKFQTHLTTKGYGVEVYPYFFKKNSLTIKNRKKPVSISKIFLRSFSSKIPNQLGNQKKKNSKRLTSRGIIHFSLILKNIRCLTKFNNEKFLSIGEKKIYKLYYMEKKWILPISKFSYWKKNQLIFKNSSNNKTLDQTVNNKYRKNNLFTDRKSKKTPILLEHLISRDFLSLDKKKKFFWKKLFQQKFLKFIPYVLPFGVEGVTNIKKKKFISQVFPDKKLLKTPVLSVAVNKIRFHSMGYIFQLKKLNSLKEKSKFIDFHKRNFDTLPHPYTGGVGVRRGGVAYPSGVGVPLENFKQNSKIKKINSIFIDFHSTFNNKNSNNSILTDSETDKIFSFFPLNKFYLDRNQYNGKNISRKFLKSKSVLNNENIKPNPISLFNWFSFDFKINSGLFIWSKLNPKWNLQNDFWIQKKRFSNSFVKQKFGVQNSSILYSDHQLIFLRNKKLLKIVPFLKKTHTFGVELPYSQYYKHIEFSNLSIFSNSIITENKMFEILKRLLKNISRNKLLGTPGSSSIYSNFIAETKFYPISQRYRVDKKKSNLILFYLNKNCLTLRTKILLRKEFFNILHPTPEVYTPDTKVYTSGVGCRVGNETGRSIAKSNVLLDQIPLKFSKNLEFKFHNKKQKVFLNKRIIVTKKQMKVLNKKNDFKNSKKLKSQLYSTGLSVDKRVFYNKKFFEKNFFLKKFSVFKQKFSWIEQENYKFLNIESDLKNWTNNNFQFYLVNRQGKKKYLTLNRSGLINFSESIFPYMKLKFSKKKAIKEIISYSTLPYTQRVYLGSEGISINRLQNNYSSQNFKISNRKIDRKKRKTKINQNFDGFILDFELKNELLKNLRKKFLNKRHKKQSFLKPFIQNKKLRYMVNLSKQEESKKPLFAQPTKKSRFFIKFPYCNKYKFELFNRNNLSKKFISMSLNASNLSINRKISFYFKNFNMNLKPGWVYVLSLKKTQSNIFDSKLLFLNNLEKNFLTFHQFFLSSGKMLLSDLNFEQNSIYIENCTSICLKKFANNMKYLFSQRYSNGLSKIEKNSFFKNLKAFKNKNARYLVNPNPLNFSLLIRPIYSKILPNNYDLKTSFYEVSKSSDRIQKSSQDLIKDYHSNLLNKQFVEQTTFVSGFPSFDFSIEGISPLKNLQNKYLWFDFEKIEKNLDSSLINKFEKPLLKSQKKFFHQSIIDKNSKITTSYLPPNTPKGCRVGNSLKMRKINQNFGRKEKKLLKNFVQKYLFLKHFSKTKQKIPNIVFKIQLKEFVKKSILKNFHSYYSYNKIFYHSVQSKYQNPNFNNSFLNFSTPMIEINSKIANLKSKELNQHLPFLDREIHFLTKKENSKNIEFYYSKKNAKIFGIQNLYSLPYFKWSFIAKTAYLGNQRIFSHLNLSQPLNQKQIKIAAFTPYTNTIIDSGRLSFTADKLSRFSKNSFLFYKSNFILKNSKIANTDIYSPFEGELVSSNFEKNSWWNNFSEHFLIEKQRKNNYQIILTKKDLFSIFFPKMETFEKFAPLKLNPMSLKTFRKNNAKFIYLTKSFFKKTIDRHNKYEFSITSSIYRRTFSDLKKLQAQFDFRIPPRENKGKLQPKILQFYTEGIKNTEKIKNSNFIITKQNLYIDKNIYNKKTLFDFEKIPEKQKNYSSYLKNIYYRNVHFLQNFIPYTEDIWGTHSTTFFHKENYEIKNFLTKYQKRFYKLKGLDIGKPNKLAKLRLGYFLFKGDFIHSLKSFHKTGQILHFNLNKITFRNAQPFLVSAKGILHVHQGDPIFKNLPIITLPFDTFTTGDIVQGIPKVEQYLEARTTLNGRLFLYSLPVLLQGIFKRYYTKFSLDQAVSQTFLKIQLIIVDGVQRVYRSQGVSISDKHLEVIVKQMTSKVRILQGGQTGFFPGELVDLEIIERINPFLMVKIQYEPVVLGITRASLEVESFLSAASFQQTTKILAKASLYKKKDFLKGLKENILIGNLVPAGTGYMNRL